MGIKLSGLDVSFDNSGPVLTGQRDIHKSGIRNRILSGSKIGNFHWNGHRFPPLPSGCVLYFPGYPAQGSTIKDFSGNGNDGTITEATWTRLPSGLWGLSFDATNDVVTVTNVASLQLTTFSLEFWVYPNSEGATTEYDWISKGDNQDGFYLRQENGTGIRFFTYKETGIRLDKAWTGVVASGSWYHIFLTYTNSSPAVNLQINGVAKAEATSANDMGPNSGYNLKIGKSLVATDGKMGLIRYYSGVVSVNHFQQERHLFGV